MNRLRGGSRGQTSPIGVVLILAIAILGTTVIVALGSAALTDTQSSANLQQAEHAMTQFDSGAAQVALGQSEIHSMEFGNLEGDYHVDQDAGWMKIVHENYDGSNDEVIYNGTLGAVVFRNGDSEIAYQGGGVWRLTADGHGRLVSPPEFHYREGTLTLPVIRVRGSGSASGRVTGQVVRSASVERIYPDRSQNYDGGTRAYENPVAKGNVTVWVHSRYYEGWAQYFRQRTDGEVTEFPGNQTVKVDLLTKGLTGNFPMPNDGGSDSLTVRGIDPGHSLTDFEFTIIPKDNQESELKNLRWSLYTSVGSKRFEIALGGGDTVDCGDDETVPLAIYYTNNSHDTYQGWTGTVTLDCSDDPDGDGDPTTKLRVDLVDEPVTLTYEKVSGSQLAEYNNEISKNDIEDPGAFVTHPGADAEDNHALMDYSTSATENSTFVVNHYFALLAPTFELKVSDQQTGGAAGVSESNSGGYIDYEGSERVVTYLHVTENELTVELN